MLKFLAIRILTVMAFAAPFAISSAWAQAQAQAPGTVDVFVGFDRPPGASQQSLVQGFGGSIKYTYRIVNAIAANLPETAVGVLLRSPGVVTVERDGRVQAVDAELDAAWGVKRVGAGDVHSGNTGNTGFGIKVAVIDSGIDYTHSDLDGNYVGGWDFVNNDADPMDDHSHGTHVAGTIAAEDNDQGVVGVAPSADLYALKVLNSSGSGSWSDIVAAVQWTVDNGIQITNNSYGAGSYPGSTVETAFNNAASAGVLHVAAAGNSGNFAGTGDNVIYPARFASVVAVGATSSTDARASFSSTGPAVELAAPGVAITSTVPGGGLSSKNGTSMASPHVAGVAALVMASGVTSASEVRARLTATADDLGDPGNDTWYGHGIVNAVNAVSGASAEPPAPPADAAPTVTITKPIDGDTVSKTVTIRADASDDVAVAKVEFFVDGVSVGVDTSDWKGWSVKWDSKLVADGNHTITARAYDSAGQTADDGVGVAVNNASGGGGGSNRGKGNNK